MFFFGSYIVKIELLLGKRDHACSNAHSALALCICGVQMSTEFLSVFSLLQDLIKHHLGISALE